MTRRPTIHDVAARAGVSKSTVSLVVRGSDQIRPQTAQKVRQAMGDLGYVYNRSAANLRSADAGLIGLVINDLRNPFFTEFATRFQMALAVSGYATVISNSAENPDLQAKLVGSMIEHGVSGIVISPTYGKMGATFDQIARAGLPALQVLRQLDDRVDLFPFSGFDYATGSAAATRHLLDLGAQNIAFIGGMAGRAITDERKQGYLDELRAAGRAPILLHGQATRAFGLDTASRLWVDHRDVDGAICFNDLVALGVVSGLARVGRQAGKDLRLVGFDDIEECQQIWPQLSSVSCDIAQFAQDTATRLLQWLDKGQRPDPILRAPVSLVARASSLGMS